MFRLKSVRDWGQVLLSRLYTMMKEWRGNNVFLYIERFETGRNCERETGGRRTQTAILTHIFLTMLILYSGPYVSAFLTGISQPGSAEPRHRAPADRSGPFCLTNCMAVTDHLSVGACAYFIHNAHVFRLSFRLSTRVICVRLFTQVHPAYEIPNWWVCQRSICNTKLDVLT